jgi:macrodomain Ter protein organizer (MatP/YcbG family)
MAKTEIQSTRQEAVPKDFTVQQQLARLVCEVSRNLEDRTIEAMLEAYLRKQT